MFVKAAAAAEMAGRWIYVPCPMHPCKDSPPQAGLVFPLINARSPNWAQEEFFWESERETFGHE